MGFGPKCSTQYNSDKLSSLIELSVQHRGRQKNWQDKVPTLTQSNKESKRRDWNRSRGQKAEVITRGATSRIVQDRQVR
ncbi:hypothetical protein LDENG_00112340 [Lucifuga dentata]|nr:hypothetical protein LDENG_00112340 [Lucifuga dentata]